jgi:3-deoxy-D-manno-octulosonic acid (KDO) 8-phosphate synthase
VRPIHVFLSLQKRIKLLETGAALQYQILVEDMESFAIVCSLSTKKVSGSTTCLDMLARVPASSWNEDTSWWAGRASAALAGQHLCVLGIRHVGGRFSSPVHFPQSRSSPTLQSSDAGIYT